jgi:polysaccharide pyruvyl transferase WcaK-like protein
MIKPQKILIAGATGYGNMGDDAVRQRMTSHLRTRGVEVKVTRPYPQRELVQWCDKLILGGGGIIYDHPTDQAQQQNFDYYVNQYLAWAVELGKPVALCSIGIQALKVEANIERFRALLKHVKFVSVRQPEDAAILRKHDLYQSPIVADDLALALRPSPFTFTAPTKRRKACVIPQVNYVRKFGIEPIEWLVDELKKMNYEVYTALTAVEDVEVGQKIAQAIGDHGSVRDFLYLAPRELISLLGEMDVVLSSRFHGLIFAKAGGCEAIYSLNKASKLAQQLHKEAVLLDVVRNRDLPALKAALKAPVPLKSHGHPQQHLMMLDAFLDS